MEIEFAQNMKRSWYCTRLSFQSGDIKEGLSCMRKAIKQVNGFLVEMDQKPTVVGGLVKGLK